MAFWGLGGGLSDGMYAPDGAGSALFAPWPPQPIPTWPLPLPMAEGSAPVAGGVPSSGQDLHLGGLGGSAAGLQAGPAAVLPPARDSAAVSARSIACLGELRLQVGALAEVVSRTKDELRSHRSHLSQMVVRAVLTEHEQRLPYGTLVGHSWQAQAATPRSTSTAPSGPGPVDSAAEQAAGMSRSAAQAAATSAGTPRSTAAAAGPEALFLADSLHAWSSFKLQSVDPGGGTGLIPALGPGASQSGLAAAAAAGASETAAAAAARACAGSGDDAAACALQSLLYTSLENDAYAGECRVEGRLPSWCRGTLYRTGPGLWECGRRALRHEYDGFPVVAAVRFDGPPGPQAQVSAAQRFIDDEPYRAARRGEPLLVDKFASRRKFSTWGEWSQDRMRSVMGKQFYDQAGSNLTLVAGRLISFNATSPGNYFAIDPHTLKTTAKTFSDDLALDGCALFPSLDVGGESPAMVGVAVSAGKTLYKFAPAGLNELSREEVGRLPMRTSAPSFPSCVAASPRYIIYPEFPLYASLSKMMGFATVDSDDDDENITGTHYAFDWVPQDGVLMYTLERTTGRARKWALPEAWWAAQITNVFDADDMWLVVDVAMYTGPLSLKACSLRKRRAPLGSGANLPRNRLMRIRIPVGLSPGEREGPDTQMSIVPLCPPSSHGDFLLDICIDPRRSGRPYRYVFGNCVADPRPCNIVRGCCKVSLLTGCVTVWRAPHAMMAGKPVYVPRPGSADDDEEDGVLLADCLHEDGYTFYAVLDVRTFSELARVVLPYRQCVSRSATWVPAGPGPGATL